MPGAHPRRDELQPLAGRALARRAALGLTQAQVAERAGVEWRTICRIEHARHHPRALLLLGVARALGVTTDWLLTGEGD